PTLVLRAGSVVMTATEVRRAARISGKALSSSARPATLYVSAPRLAACAAKSTPEPSGNRLLNEAMPQADVNILRVQIRSGRIRKPLDRTASQNEPTYGVRIA